MPHGDPVSLDDTQLVIAGHKLAGNKLRVLAVHLDDKQSDPNGDLLKKVSIGDLSLMVPAYGKTSADADWSTWAKYDLNNDGAIDILDLAMLARTILDGQ